MAYGIQILTSDGQKTTLDFKAGRYVGTSSETGIKNNVDHAPPSDVDLSDPDLIVFPTYDYSFSIGHYYAVNALANVIEIRNRPGISYDPGAAGASITFVYIRFQ